MSFYSSWLTQTVTVWPKAGTDRYGDPTRGTPTEYVRKVRWERTRKDMMAPDGTRVNVDVVLAYDCRLTLAVDDVVYLGTLDGWYGTGSGGTDSELMRVSALDWVPGIAGDDEYREAGLVKFRDTLPDTA